LLVPRELAAHPLAPKPNHDTHKYCNCKTWRGESVYITLVIITKNGSNHDANYCASAEFVGPFNDGYNSCLTIGLYLQLHHFRQRGWRSEGKEFPQVRTPKWGVHMSRLSFMWIQIIPACQ
jgi:hypothetical protein